MGPKGTASYDAAAGKFNEVDSNKDYDIGSDLSSNDTGLFNVPYDYGTEADFLKKVDLSIAGEIMDCGECHVGGGAMEFIPNPDMAARTPLRDIATAAVPGFGGTVGGASITDTNYTAFNYFIDNYDVDGDGNETEVQYMDYTKTGVMEMDCLMCHMPGYDYVARREILRDAKVDATRAIGAGFASDNGLLWADGAAAPEGYGTTVVYDNSKFDTNSGTLKLSGDWMDQNLATKPPSENCAFCHMNEFSVDWKKRGDHWAPEGQYEYQYEVHYSIGCMGCHERKPTAAQPGPFNSVYGGGSYPEMGAGLLGHDPAKGDSQYSGLYNINDKAAFKDCVNCHVTGADGGSVYGAPSATAAHIAAGLTTPIAQGNTIDGVAKISHIDMMTCAACHTRKASSADWNTGNPLIDATGGDHDKRLTDHENDYVIKQDMTDNTSLAWYKGKLQRVSPSATMFWRDKNDTPALDANFDGRPHGMDALLMTDVLAVNNDPANDWHAITYEEEGNVSPRDFGDRITALNSYIEGKAGVVAGTAKTKFSVFHVNFVNQHAVSPASMAWGAGGCADCHSSTSEFYNGSIDTTGDDNTMTFATGTAQRVPFTKVNGFAEPTDWHPMQLDKLGNRSIAIQISNVTTWDDDDDPLTPEVPIMCDADENPATPDVACMTTRPVERSENMYEATFKGAANYATDYSSSGAIDFSGFEKGWQLIVQVDDGTERLKMIGGDLDKISRVDPNVPDPAALLDALGSNMTDGTFGFTIVDNGAGGITIAGIGGKLIRLRAGNAASFKMIDAAYQTIDWVGVDGNLYDNRADWVAYLDTITEGPGPIEPVALIDNINGGAAIVAGTAVSLVADTAADTEGTFTYRWSFTDGSGEILEGSTVSKTFAYPGTFSVGLKVTNDIGALDQINQYVTVAAPTPPVDITSTDNGIANEQIVTFSNLPVTYTRLYGSWGDGYRFNETIVGSPDPTTLPHTFRKSSRYLNGDGNYEYNVAVYVYNDAARVAILRGKVIISP